MAAHEFQIEVKEEASNGMAAIMIHVAEQGNPERAETLYDRFYSFIE